MSRQSHYVKDQTQDLCPAQTRGIGVQVPNACNQKIAKYDQNVEIRAIHVNVNELHFLVSVMARRREPPKLRGQRFPVLKNNKNRVGTTTKALQTTLLAINMSRPTRSQLRP